MAKIFKSNKGPWVLIILLIAGAMAGNALGGLFSSLLPALKPFTRIGLKPTSLDLNFAQIYFGFTMSLGPMTALGLAVGFIAYRKL